METVIYFSFEKSNIDEHTDYIKNNEIETETFENFKKNIEEKIVDLYSNEENNSYKFSNDLENEIESDKLFETDVNFKSSSGKSDTIDDLANNYDPNDFIQNKFHENEIITVGSLKNYFTTASID